VVHSLCNTRFIGAQPYVKRKEAKVGKEILETGDTVTKIKISLEGLSS